MGYTLDMLVRDASGNIKSHQYHVQNATAYFAKVLKNPALVSAFVVDKASGDIVKQVIRG